MLNNSFQILIQWWRFLLDLLKPHGQRSDRSAQCLHGRLASTVQRLAVGMLPALVLPRRLGALPSLSPLGLRLGGLVLQLLQAHAHRPEGHHLQGAEEALGHLGHLRHSFCRGEVLEVLGTGGEDGSHGPPGAGAQRLAQALALARRLKPLQREPPAPCAVPRLAHGLRSVHHAPRHGSVPLRQGRVELGFRLARMLLQLLLNLVRLGRERGLRLANLALQLLVKLHLLCLRGSCELALKCRPGHTEARDVGRLCHSGLALGVPGIGREQPERLLERRLG
mmetsp:Transcript_16206/g.44623  ORF Transcript_16206/g.44623 Transcript_16206/m.44623 type:complete len:280 (-) Transcript_16206:114-953(-)